jgi:arylsulfatase A-like enzyme
MKLALWLLGLSCAGFGLADACAATGTPQSTRPPNIVFILADDLGWSDTGAYGSRYDEGGTRDPFIVRWPGVTPPGTTSDAPAMHVDVLPTFLELAGAKPPEGQVLDGGSLVPLFRDPKASLNREAIYQHFPGYLGAGAGTWRTTPVGSIQTGDWKLLEFFEDGRLELYNLRSDPGESRNLVPDQPERARELHTRLRAWRERINAPMPTPNR